MYLRHHPYVCVEFLGDASDGNAIDEVFNSLPQTPRSAREAQSTKADAGKTAEFVWANALEPAMDPIESKEQILHLIRVNWLSGWLSEGLDSRGPVWQRIHCGFTCHNIALALPSLLL